MVSSIMEPLSLSLSHTHTHTLSSFLSLSIFLVFVLAVLFSFPLPHTPQILEYRSMPEVEIAEGSIRQAF